MNGIWITWENQRRNRELSRALGMELFEMAYIDAIKNCLKKYLSGLAKTLVVLFKRKLDLTVCQNPSLILSFFLILTKGVIRQKVCVDAHNSGLFPSEGRSRFLGLLSRFVQRLADLTLVSNEALKKHVEANGGRAFVLPDRIPQFLETKKQELKGLYNLLFICSYAADEPYEMLFNAARSIDPEIVIYVTGNYQKRGIKPEDLPSNIILTGFLPEDEYIRMLNSVDGTIDLTTRENCLVCGAYETLAVEKPMILSSTKALKRYFSAGAVYADHTVENMVCAIQELLERKEELTLQATSLKLKRNTEWEAKKEQLMRILTELVFGSNIVT